MGIYQITNKRIRTSMECVWWLQWFINNDIHKWIIAQEVGNDGYKHWHIRIQTCLEWKELKALFPEAHIENCEGWSNYERKEGKFFQWDDTPEKLQTRFGTKRMYQEMFIKKVLETQNDRQIDVMINKGGNIGKSWLVNHLFETGIAFYCPPTLSNPKEIIQFIASGYNNEPLIVIDIPRSTKWSNDLYIAIETIKDGLVYDGRYKTSMRNIRGVKVAVMTNYSPNVKALSVDRWRLVEM